MEKRQEMIKNQANYCLQCKIQPCSKKGCPLGNHIPKFIEAIKEKKMQEAYEILTETTVLSGICGRICPHTKQCQGSCIRGIKGEPVNIGELESYIFDLAIKNGTQILPKSKEKTNKKVAIVGGGPAGLTCAAFLAREGIEVTIYEKYDYLGGLLSHGIPEFRLPKKIVEETIETILELGIKVKYNQELGKNLELATLEENYDAVFLAMGANCSGKMGIKGENLPGVYGGNELLEHQNHPDYTGKRVAVIGGGNVAMDCSRTIKRLGAKEVSVIYRRAKEQMPAEQKEIQEAEEEGINFLFQNNIVTIIGEEKVERLELIKTKLVKREGETRAVPVNIEESNYEIPIDIVVMALGSTVPEEVLTLGLTVNKWGNIIINENYQTSNPKIYAGGDVAGTAGTVAWASQSGREAAKKIIEKIGC